MSTRVDYHSAIDAQVSQVKFTGESQMDKAIAKAVRIYSGHRPRLLVADIAGADTFKYALSVLSGWDDDFSTVKLVEHPVDDSSAEKTFLDNEEWRIYQAPGGKELHLSSDAASGETIRVTYTAMHSCGYDTCTIPAADEIAVQSLAAAYFCRMLAAAYAESSDSTIAADSVDHQSKPREYESQAKAFEREYAQDIGLKPGKPGPACQVVDLDVNLSNGRDRLTHPRRLR